MCGLGLGVFSPQVVFMQFLLSAALPRGFPLCSISGIKQELRSSPAGRHREGGESSTATHFSLWNSHFRPSPQVRSKELLSSPPLGLELRIFLILPELGEGTLLRHPMDRSHLHSKVLPQPQLWGISSEQSSRWEGGKKNSNHSAGTGLVSARLNPTNLKAWIAG